MVCVHPPLLQPLLGRRAGCSCCRTHCGSGMPLPWCPLPGRGVSQQQPCAVVASALLLVLLRRWGLAAAALQTASVCPNDPGPAFLSLSFLAQSARVPHGSALTAPPPNHSSSSRSSDCVAPCGMHVWHLGLLLWWWRQQQGALTLLPAAACSGRPLASLWVHTAALNLLSFCRWGSCC